MRRKREVEDDERRNDEEQHRRQRVPCAQLEQEVLARERAHVSEICRHASASFVVARGETRSGSCVESSTVRSPRSSVSWASSSSAPALSRAVKGSSRTSS